MSKHPQAPDDTESVVKRWARRKAESADRASPGAVGDAPEPVRPRQEDELAADGERASQDEQEDERVKTDADMPDLDSIDHTTDMSAFFSPGVSETLRAQALRRLFRLPKFNVTDGLDDYNEDFRSYWSVTETVASNPVERLDTGAESRGATDRGEQVPQRETGAGEPAADHGRTLTEAQPDEVVETGVSPAEETDDPDADEPTPGERS